jgi:3-phosphoshikimate 1-carboxyvinyltransferase
MPGDKSISHRALILSALAPGSSVIQGINQGADVTATLECLRSLGVTAEVDEAKHQVTVDGSRPLTSPDDVLNAGNSGTTLRTLLGLCSSVPGLSILTGDDTLRRRPMLRVVEPLRKMGASITGRQGGELAPLVVNGGDLVGRSHELAVSSAQVKTALLLAGLRADGTTQVSEPAPSRDHTERMLTAAGVAIGTADGRSTVTGGQEPGPMEWVVPGDVSSALFLVVAATLVPGSDLRIPGVGLNPTRIGALEALVEMGAATEWSEEAISGGEPQGTIRARLSELRAIDIGGGRVATLIDEIPILAIAASQAEGISTFRDASELRLKESDRITTTVDGLNALGGHAEALPDGMVVHGPTALRGGHVDSKGDHRIAMAFAVAALIATGDVKIRGWSSVETSFPGFLDVLAAARGRR